MSDDERTGGRIMRESGKLSVLTMISRILGLVRDTTRAGMLGTKVLGESFTTAFSTPNYFRRLFAEGSMAVALIPTMKSYFTAGQDRETEEFLSATFTVLVYAVGLVVAAGVAASGAIAGMFGAVADPGTPVDVPELAALLRIMFPFLALVSVAAFLQGILNARDIFGPPGYAPILFNLAFIAVPWLIGGLMPNPARAMAVGVLVGGFLQAACQVPAVMRLGVRFRLVSPWKALANPGMKRVMRLIAPTIVGMAAYELNGLVSTALANGTGTATSISLSIRLQELILGVFVVSLGTVLLPELAGLAAANDAKRFVARFVSGIETALLVTVPVAVFSIIERVDMITLLFKSGEFDDASVAQTAAAFFYHSLGLAFIGLNRIMAPAFYARGNTRKPTAAGIASFAVNIVLALALSRVMGGQGIALALSLASAVNTAILVAMLFGLKLEGLGRGLRSASWYAVKLSAYSAVAAVPVVLLREPLKAWFGSAGSRLVYAGMPFLVSALVFCVIGIGLLILTKDSVALALASSFRHSRSRAS